jgi:hypothetical protein
MTLEDWASSLGRILEDRLDQGGKSAELVSSLASGAAFEAWLSFEARLLLEQHREEFGLADIIQDSDGTPVPRYYFANEWRKVDLCVSEYRPEAPELDSCLTTIEFKLIHNNKNWPTKLTEVHEDLFPSGRTKAAMVPSIGRLSVVGLVGKVYRNPAGYPGHFQNIAQWECDIMAALSGPQVLGRQLWLGRRFPIHDPWLDGAVPNFFRLLALGPQPA